MAGHNKWSKIKHRKAVVDKRRGNGLLFWSAPNRGDKRAFNALNQGLSSSNDPTTAGDALALRRGYSMRTGPEMGEPSGFLAIGTSRVMRLLPGSTSACQPDQRME